MTRTRIHPTLNVIATALSWLPAAVDTTNLTLNVTSWVSGLSTAHGCPSPSAIFCADKEGAPLSFCNVSGAVISTLSRVASTYIDDSLNPHSHTAASATNFVGTVPLVAPIVITHKSPGMNWGIMTQINVPKGIDTVWVITAVVESMASYTTPPDPTPSALELCVKWSQPGAAAVLETVSDTFWANYYARSSVTLPPPFLQTLYDGAAYILGSTTAVVTTGVLMHNDSNNDGNTTTAPPGLYGVFATSDDAAWNGDFTLDYNQESTFFGVFSTNHADNFVTYAAPLISWIYAGQIEAQVQAATAKITCPSTALHFSCHLAPWGLMSDDQTVYMHWNLPFAIIPILSQWEFIHDVEAASNAWPLIVGAVDWLGCFLQRNNVTGLLHDWNEFNPDEEHETQIVVDPQIGLAFAARLASISLDIALGLGVPPPSSAQDIVDHLTAFNTDGTVWVAYANATPAQSDTFALYPAFPSEAFSTTVMTDKQRLITQASSTRYGLSPIGQSGRPLDIFSAAVVGLAGARTVMSANAPTPAILIAGLRGYAKVALGRNALAIAPGGGVENAGLSRGLADMLLFSSPFSSSSTGLVMRWFARLFAAWGEDEDAQFSGLVAKGGCEFSAQIKGGLIAPIVHVSALYLLPSDVNGFGNCSMANPWSNTATSNVTVTCGGNIVAVVWLNVNAAGGGTEPVLSFLAPQEVSCTVLLLN